MNSFQKEGVKLFIQVSASIAIPIVIALILGKYLDGKYGTSPFIFLGLSTFAFIISLISIWKNLKKYIDKIEKVETINKTEKQQ